MFTVYILQSGTTGKYYVGYTNNIQNRLRQHNTGSNASTKIGIPWKIVKMEQFDTKAKAWSRERQIKNYKGGAAFKKLLEKQ